ncbi:Rpn family recombination-promoting nuclease/putative transposase [Citrobacter sp. Cpo015]|uniref:Rpn family recombination-promoting nuclease/putative transposase n=1 Tax=Citrobacter sp. Cpo015 TaxID=2985121 RepID=UPI0025781DB4|nr:Rpn family recombination-promoting nuclease/putative transposase [Citrobacter sp. Cpo015]MBJ8835799.1 Rpn family recombination-promoting nuclease/putative transposase [Citrobacter freundii]MDM2906837.1 Rpn family recombination-promoting nuclease/putative transposase [Citrobacter sp. Cpo015]
MAEVATPHDAVFKTFLSRVETARDFIELHLPPSLIKICKLETLRLESGSFVEDDLRPYFSDILYSLETTSGHGYVHVLIEHQSSPDKHMSFRLMRYAIAAMQRHLEAGNDTLPLVIPVLFYHGKQSPWQGSMNWLDHFEDSGTALQLYSTPFPLVDVTVIPDDEIMQHRSMAALTLVQKHIRQRDMAQLLDKLTRLFMLEKMSGQQITVLVNYMVQAGNTQDVQTLLYKLAQRVPQHGEKLMTMADQLKQIGREEGRRIALTDVAKAMLKRGLDTDAIMEMTGLSKDELQKLAQ